MSNNLSIFDENTTKAIKNTAKDLTQVINIATLTTENDLKIAYNTFNAIDNISNYKKAKIISRILNENLYVGISSKFDDYIKKSFNGLGKSQAYNYAKAGTLICDSGNHSIFFDDEMSAVNDFSITSLVRLAESGISLDTLQVEIDKGNITPKDSVQKLCSYLKKLKGLKDDLSDMVNVTETETETVTETETETEKDSKDIKTYIMQSNLYKDLILQVYEFIKKDTNILTSTKKVEINFVIKD